MSACAFNYSPVESPNCRLADDRNKSQQSCAQAYATSQVVRERSRASKSPGPPATSWL